MSRVCQITGKKTAVGNNRSHSMRATRRKFYPNLFYKNFSSDTMFKILTIYPDVDYSENVITGKCRVRISAKGLKTLRKYGIV